MKKNPILFWLAIVFLLVNIADMITTFLILPGEANPIVLLTKTPWSLAVIKVALLVGIYMFYKKNTFPNNISYFGFLLVLVLGTTAIGFAVYGNILGIMNPVIVEQAAAMSTQEKVEGYSYFVGLFYVLPIMMSLLAFWLYDKSLKDTTIKPEKIKWWWKK